MDTCYLTLGTWEGLGNEITSGFFCFKNICLTEPERMQLRKLCPLPLPPPPPLQEEPLQVPGPLQNGRQSLGFHRHSLRDEGIRLDPGESLQLREAETQHHAPQRGLYEAAV